MNIIDDAFERIKSAAQSIKDPLIIKATKQFGDCLHSSIIVRHFRELNSKRHIIWAISEKYLDAFKYFNYASTKVGLPHGLTLDDRQELGKRLRSEFSDVVLPCVGPFGWNTSGSIACQFFHNAGISKLVVPRRPILPIGAEDETWANNFITNNGLTKRVFVCMEYNSYSFKRLPEGPIWTIDMYNEFLDKMGWPVVWLADSAADKLRCGVDGRGCSWRQAAALIRRAALFIGCGSGLTMVAATDGVNTPILEVNIGDTISMTGCNYKKSIVTHNETPNGLTARVAAFLHTV